MWLLYLVCGGLIVAGQFNLAPRVAAVIGFYGAVLLTAYEWYKAGDDTPVAALANYEAPAPHAELEGLIGALSAALETARYFGPPETVAAKRLALRNMLTRPAWSAKEVRTWRGMVTALAKQPR